MVDRLTGTLPQVARRTTCNSPLSAAVSFSSTFCRYDRRSVTDNVSSISIQYNTTRHVALFLQKMVRVGFTLRGSRHTKTRVHSLRAKTVEDPRIIGISAAVASRRLLSPS